MDTDKINNSEGQIIQTRFYDVFYFAKKYEQKSK